MNWIELFLLLVGIHYVCDFSLQTEFMAQGKGDFGVPLKGVHWYHCMVAHCAVHGLGVGLATHHWEIGIFEFVAHYYIDWSKVNKRIGINMDQATHIFCKVVWTYCFFRFCH